VWRNVSHGVSEEAETVATKGKSRRAPLLLSALVLAACSATGLVTGVITRQVASAAAPVRTSILAQATSTPTAPRPTATSVPTSPAVSSSQFAVSISVFGQPHPGQDIQVAASVLAADSPVAGARCTLASDAGSDPLLQTWPDAVNTDATGKCAWTITLPQQTAPGAYRIRVDGYTAQYHAWSFTTVRVA
jgi:hypothetical protein